MKSAGFFALIAFAPFACLLPLTGRAGALNLATVSCNKYENEVLASAPDVGAGTGTGTGTNQNTDSINTVMWLFGYSVATLGEHVMYGDALASFGFALDAECKNNPSTSLLEALKFVRPKRDKPMDLTTLSCATFESRHVDLVRTDPESATTIMMWLFGYSVAQSGSHLFDPSAMPQFSASLQARCTQHPDESLFDALGSGNKGAPKQ
jgi:hypothetical protein